ncbi:MAG: UbiA family prenyltransferase [Bacteroidota bacterium]
MLKSVSGIFRLSNWWSYIFPPILGIAYLMELYAEHGIKGFVFILIPFCISVIGAASYGFIINDISDKKSDKLAGKSNIAAKYSKRTLWLFVIASISVAIVPWFFLPVSMYAIALFLIQMALLTFYSLPPLRIKDSVFFSIITDALYSSLIPALIALFIFGYDLNPDSSLIIVFTVLMMLYFLRGLRNIMLHQLADVNNDEKSGITTFVIKYGSKTAYNRLKYIIATELVLLMGFVALLAVQIQYFWLIVPVTVLYYIIKIKSKYTRPKSKNDYYLYLNDFYEDILPVGFLGLLSVINPWFIILFIIHVVIFENKLVWHMLIVWLYYKIFHNKYAKQVYGLFKK